VVTRTGAILACAAFLATVTAGPVGAHEEEPGARITLTVQLLWVGTTVNLDDGPNGLSEILVRYGIHHVRHPPIARGEVTVLYDFANPANNFVPGVTGGLQAVGVTLYTHEECYPPNAVRIDYRGWEDDDIPPDANLGSGHRVVEPPAPWASSTTTGGPPANGALVAVFSVTFALLPGNCR